MTNQLEAPGSHAKPTAAKAHPTPNEWPGATDYSRVAAGGRAALAWEFLRRNAEYVAETDAMELFGKPANNSFVKRWGLHFCREPVSKQRDGDANMVRRC